MKIATVIVVLVGVAFASATGCMSARDGEIAPPVVTVAPDAFVLRDVRKDAARHLGCQVPMVSVRMGPWAGSEGNVIVFGCGYEITYYLRCLTNHLCSFSIT